MSLSPKRIFVVSSIHVCLLTIAIQATAWHRHQSIQTQSTVLPVLQLNQPLTGTLKPGETHTYKLHLSARTFARVRVKHKSATVLVRAYDLQKKRLAHADTSYDRTVPKVLEFVGETEGDYLVEVKAGQSELDGVYEIEYVDARIATDEDRKRVAANNLVVEGTSLQAKAEGELTRGALVPYNKALALYKQINDKAGQATALQQIGRVYESQSDPNKALEYFSSALGLWRELRSRRGEAFNIERIGVMHYFLGNLDLAFPYFQQAVEIYRELGYKSAEGFMYNHIANFYSQKGDIDKALEYFQKGLSILRGSNSTVNLAYLLNNMGVAYRDIGDLKQAADYLNQALVIWRKLQHKHGTASAFTTLASIYSQQGEMRKALSFYQQALPFCVQLGDEHCEARAYWRLASVYSSLGETQTALDYYAKTAAIYRRAQRTVELIRMLNSSGALYASLGDKPRASAFHFEALALSRKAQSRRDEAASLSSLAELYEDDDSTQKSRDLYLQALAISRETKNRLNEATTLNRLGLLAHAAGDNHEAIKLFEQALVMSNELGARYHGALVLNNLGIVHNNSGNPKPALDYFTRALAVFREIENKSGEAMMLYRVAVAQKKLGQSADARRNITAALEIVETIRGKIASTDLRASYFATVQQYYDLYIELLMQDHRARPNDALNFTALQTSEQARARGLLDLLQEAGADARHNVDASLLAREKELVELINGKTAQQTLFFADPKKVELAKTLGEEIDRLEIEYETLQSAIRESNPRFAELVRGKTLNLAEIQRLLDERTLLLEYRLGDERSYLWVISQTKFESYELPRRAEIESEARQYYELLTERNRALKNETITQRQTRIQAADQKLQALAERLHRMLITPIGAAAGQRLVIVGDGALQYVPFSALLRSANETISLPSIAVLDQLRREPRSQPPPKSVAVFADPVFESDDPRLAPQFRRKIVRSANILAQSQSDFDFAASGRGLPRLFASREEAKSILALAPAVSYGALDFEASRERVISSDLHQYRVLHFATHALLNHARPQLSGVVLSLYDQKGKERDGFLRLNQIYNLRLSSELVVLSACSTALGKDVRGEGLVGLTRGFMYAGAPRVIASLWKVDDEATAELMKLFYRNLLHKKMTPSQALTAAQMEMQTQPRWRSPYYWAAFTLQGDWR